MPLDGMSLDQLRTFIAAAEEVVSQTLANLEKQLGVKLFDRSGRYPRVTDPGQALLNDAKAIADGMDCFKARAKILREGSRDVRHEQQSQQWQPQCRDQQKCGQSRL
jgi:DNA-binding transcriptional LysR family regulator